MIFTHSGKFGDSLLLLPVASWFAKVAHERPSVLLSRFPYADQALRVIESQPCVRECTIVDNVPEGYGMGGQPYKWNPADHGFTGEYRNIGFRYYPDEYVSEHYAKEHSFGVDYDFTLDYGKADPTYSGQDVKLDRWDSPMLRHVDAVALSSADDILTNLRYAAGARSVSAFHTGIAIALALARIPFTLYIEPDRMHNYMHYFAISNIQQVIVL